MKKFLTIGAIICIAFSSCKEMKKDTNSTADNQWIEISSIKELQSNYQKVFEKNNLADKIKLSLYKHSKKDKFSNSISHTFIFGVKDTSSWDDLSGYKVVLQFIPIEEERGKLNDISKKRKVLSEYFVYDILEHLSRANSDNLINIEGKTYFVVNIHSNLNHLESLNVYLQDKKTYKPFGQKISIQNYSLLKSSSIND